MTRLGDDTSPAALHDVRIKVKRTRYAAEAFGSPARRFAKSLAKTQDILGERNDAVVAEEWLTANADRLDPGEAFAAGGLAQLARSANTAGNGWTEPYRRAARKRNRSWFG